MKNYLNKADTDCIMIISGLYRRLEQKLRLQTDIDKEEKKYLSFVKTYCLKHIDFISNNLAENELKKLLKYNENYEVNVTAKGSTRFNAKDYDNLRNYVIADKCNNCNGELKLSCELRNILSGYDENETDKCKFCKIEVA